MRIFLTFWGLASVILADLPFLFPHGYFDTRKLQPRDMIYLNMMAQSNLEYGGTTLEALNKLVADKHKVPPPYKTTKRPEAFTMATRDPESPFHAAFEEKKIEELDGKVSTESNSKMIDDNFPTPPPSPFAKVRLAKKKKALKRYKDEAMNDDEQEKEELNPFEDIATRAPPGGSRRHRKKKRKNRKEEVTSPPSEENSFLTRENIQSTGSRHDKKKDSNTEAEDTRKKLSNQKQEVEEDFMVPMARGIHFRRVEVEEKKGLGEEYSKLVQERRTKSKTKSERPHPSHHSQSNRRATKEDIEAIENEIRDSYRKNHKLPSVSTTKEPKRQTTLFPTLSPPLPSPIKELQLEKLPHNPYGNVQFANPTVVALPIPPTLWKDLQ